MFDFLSSDWFIVSLEIVFLILIVFDVKKYVQTKKKEYITNIVLTIGFFIWTAIPFYNSYITWNAGDKKEYVSTCRSENNESLCECISDAVFKEYTLESFEALDKNGSDFKEFIKETKEECLDDSWF
ncbi:hypothetical protein KJ877_08595 [bacterium]|nr:hypothetical protein [bacterium]MBU1990754.1 hypothetical protein [bacterium]